MKLREKIKQLGYSVILGFTIQLIGLLPAHEALASWYYNRNAGFGVYQPENWRVIEHDRAAQLIGPENDFAQTEIFLGSDWDGKVRNLDELKSWVYKNTRFTNPRAYRISDLSGFQVGDTDEGAIFILRVPTNIIVIEYSMRGSAAQRNEGHTALSSIEIRTKESPSSGKGSH
jgi:hypothetical protein